MKIKMELVSDVIFGNGMSIPGAEDISVLCDKQGFPYYKGSALKGVLREEAENYLRWMGEEKCTESLDRLFGSGGNDEVTEQLIFTDFVFSPYVKSEVLRTIQVNKTNEDGECSDIVKNCLTHLRTFTSLTEDGVAKKGSLRIARCVNKGVSLYGEIECPKEEEEFVRNVVESIKWIGTKRNRGFGKVKFTVEGVTK